MNERADRLAIDWLALFGVGIGLVIALVIDQTMMEGMGDRPVIVTAITAAVAVVWIAIVRMFFAPKTAAAPVSKRNPPQGD